MAARSVENGAVDEWQTNIDLTSYLLDRRAPSESVKRERGADGPPPSSHPAEIEAKAADVPVPVVGKKKCSSCNKTMPLDEFDGKATCNHCRPKKRKKQAEVRRQTLAERDTLRPQVEALTAALKQKTEELDLLMEEKVRLEEEVLFLRQLHGGRFFDAVIAPPGTATTTMLQDNSTSPSYAASESQSSSASQHGLGAGTAANELASLVMSQDTTSTVVVTPQEEDVKFSAMITFEDAELEEAYQLSDTARTRVGLRCIAALFVLVGIIWAYMVPSKILTTASNKHKVMNQTSTFSLEAVIEEPWSIGVVFGLHVALGVAMLHLSHKGQDFPRWLLGDQKTVLMLLLTMLPCLVALASHVREGKVFRNLLMNGGTVYGMEFSEFEHGYALTEHIAIINWSAHLTQLQLLVQFIGAMMLDFQHCMVVFVTMVLVNTTIFSTGEYVDFNDPIQFASAGAGVHRCIIFKSLWCVAVGLVTLFMTACLDQERRALWLAGHCSHQGGVAGSGSVKVVC